MKKLVFTEDIHTYHIDFAGHVSNIVYIQWMEVGRLKLLDAVGLPVHTIMQSAGILPTLVETGIQYKKSLFLGEKVRIEVWLSQLKNVSAVMEFRFFNDKDELAATAWQRGLFVSMETRRPHRLHDKYRECFTGYLENGDSVQ